MRGQKKREPSTGSSEKKAGLTRKEEEAFELAGRSLSSLDRYPAFVEYNMMNAKSGRKPARQHSRGLSSSGRNSFGANHPYLKDSVSYSREVSAVGTRVFECLSECSKSRNARDENENSTERKIFAKKRKPFVLKPSSRENSKDKATNSLIPDIKKWIKKTAKKLKDCNKLLKEKLKEQDNSTADVKDKEERIIERKISEEKRPRHRKKNLSMYCDQKSDLNLLRQMDSDTNRNSKKQTFQFKKLKMDSIASFHATAIGAEKSFLRGGKKVNLGKQSAQDLKTKDVVEKTSRAEGEKKRLLLDCSKAMNGFKRLQPSTSKGVNQAKCFKTAQNDFKSERTKSKEDKRAPEKRKRKLISKLQLEALKSGHQKCSIGKLSKQAPSIILQSKGSFHLNFHNVNKNFIQKKPKPTLGDGSRSCSKSKSRSKSFRKDHAMCTTACEELPNKKVRPKIRRKSKAVRTGKNGAKKLARSLSKSSTDQDENGRKTKEKAELKILEDSNGQLIGNSSEERGNKHTNSLLQNIFQNIRLKEHSESSLDIFPFEKESEGKNRNEEEEEPVCMKPTSAERRERLILNKDQGKQDSQKDSQQSSSLYELSHHIHTAKTIFRDEDRFPSNMKSPSRDVTESSPSQRPALENKRTEFNNEEEVEKQVKRFMNSQLKTFRTFLNQLEVMQVPGTKINKKIDEIRRKGELSMKILKEGRDLFRNSQEPSVKNGQDRRQYPPVPPLQQGDAVSVVNSSVTGKSSNYNEKWIQPSERRYLASPLCKLPSSPSKYRSVDFDSTLKRLNKEQSLGLHGSMQYKLDQIISQKLERSLREGLDSALKTGEIQRVVPSIDPKSSGKDYHGNYDAIDDVKSTSLIRAKSSSSNTPFSEVPNVTSVSKMPEGNEFRPETSDFGPWSKRSVPGLHTNLDQTSSLRELQDSQGKFEAEFDERQKSPCDIVDSSKKDIYFSFDNAFRLNNRSSQCLVSRELDEGDTPPLTKSEDDLRLIQNELYRSSDDSNHKIFIIDEIESMHVPPIKKTQAEESANLSQRALIQQTAAVEDQISSEEDQLIDIQSLTLEEKTTAISDFIMENLILEIFTDDNRLRNKFLKASGAFKRSLQDKEKADISNYIDTLVIKSQSTLSRRDASMNRLNTPIGQTDLQKLLLLSPLIPFEELRTMALEDYDSVLDLNVYIEIEEQLMELVYNKEDLSAFQVEQKQIYHKLIFDAYNERLDHLRLYGIAGKPPTFLSSFKKQEPMDSRGVEVLMERAKEEVLRWNGSKCGLLAIEEKENINAEELEDIREEALSQVAVQYVESLEEKWKECNDEYVEVFLLVAEVVFDQIVHELVDDLTAIRTIRCVN